MTRWKYDSDPHDELARLRIPSTTRWPMYSYLAAFHRESAHRPTQAEALMIASFIGECRSRFHLQEREAMTAQPFDISVGYPTIIFHKYLKDDWAYRCKGWQIGHEFTPPSPRVATRMFGPLSLVQLMDFLHQHASGGLRQAQWNAWKRKHPEVFG